MGIREITIRDRMRPFARRLTEELDKPQMDIVEVRHLISILDDLITEAEDTQGGPTAPRKRP